MALSAEPYISLFAGAGGLDLAVRIAMPAARCVCYVEREIGAARILAARMEDGSLEAAPIWSDARTFECRRFCGRVAGIIGGFPCTDLSVAGKQAGIHGEHSGLWFEYLRIIREVQPQWVLIENVPAVIAFPAGGIVLGGLAEIGFDAEWLSLRASDVGTPHRRERVFILAYRPGTKLEHAFHGGHEGGRPSGSREVWGGDMKTCDQRLRNQAQHWPTPDANTASYSNGKFGENLRESSANWKTPHGMSGMDHTGKVGGGGEFAKQAVNWPSPQAQDAKHVKCESGRHATDLGGGQRSDGRLWTTPQSHDTHPGDAKRIGRYGSKHGAANLADDVMIWGDGEK